MTPTPPDDVAALFDLPPLPESPPPATSTLEAAEAALAAELAAELALAADSGGVADDAPDSRSGLRVEVSWPARLRLPEGRVIALQVRNISAGGVGLVSGEDLPARTVVDFEIDVPPLDAGGEATPVAGAIKTTYTVVCGAEVLCGGTWQEAPEGQALLDRWIRHLQR